MCTLSILLPCSCQHLKCHEGIYNTLFTVLIVILVLVCRHPCSIGLGSTVQHMEA